MRITGGSLNGRPIVAPPGRAVRPSSDRLREALFNILAHARDPAIPPLAGARVLDAFAGTGALGIEALSRGAAEAVFIDRQTCWARRNVEALGQTARAGLIAADVLSPPKAEIPVDIAFLDPPYGGGLAAPALAALAAAGWLGPASLAVVETGARERIAWPTGLEPVRTRRYGAARIALVEFSAGRTAVRCRRA